MTTRITRIVVTGLAAAAVATGSAAGLASAAPAGPDGGSAVAMVAADQILAERLAFNREEERMARDLYQVFGQSYPDARVFQMIPRSEQRHFDAVGRLLTAYGVTDPSAGLPAGSYAIPDIQALYDGWKARGLESAAAAYQVGIELEQRDIADLDASIAALSQSDVKAVLTALREASVRHEAAFTAAANGQTPAGKAGTGGAMRGQRGAGPGGGLGGGMAGRGPGYGGQGNRPGCPQAG